MKTDDDAFEQRVRTALDNSVTRLDMDTRRQLNAIRREAFERKPFLSRRLGFGYWVPATAFAAVAVLAVALVFRPVQQQGPDLLTVADTDVALELLTNDDVSGDPDFYVWLDVALLDEEKPSDAS
jgi:negative regulator of sigma E activity